MNEIEIGNRNLLWWFVVVFAGLMLLGSSLYWKQRARCRFASGLQSNRIFRHSLGHDLTRGLVVLSVMALLVAAVMDLRWGTAEQDVPQEGIEVIFVLDVSRSMLARDVAPNRLSRAKQMIKDTVDEMTGDRVGLVIFAGEVRQEIPLTNHYTDFKRSLDDVDPDSLDRGGSRLGDAIAVACNGFLDQSGHHKTMILLTDGGDQESKPIEAARLARANHGARIFTIGLGDIETGARVPAASAASTKNADGEYVLHNGQQVWSKLDAQMLAEIANATGAAYIPAGTKQVNMATVYQQYVSNVAKTIFETARIQQLRPRFQWFLFPATIALLAESLWIRKGGGWSGQLN